MKGPLPVQQLLKRYVVEHVNSIPADAQKLPDDDDYQVRLAYGMRFYRVRVRIWCKYGYWTKDEAARLLSGILPENDDYGSVFDQTYWSDAETFPLGPKHTTYSIFKLFKSNFECLKHVNEILSRSALGDRASPEEWAKYAQAKGLLPHDNYLYAVDNNPLLSLLETSDASVLLSPSDSEPTSQSKSPYPAPWLIIQTAAIAKFFNPRRDPDPKSAEVVAWLESEAEKAGLGKSKKIAEAIFTMIKAKHHNPKNKRG